MIDENIILKLSSGEEIVCRLVGDEHPRTFEITNPLQVIDFLGMMGDAADNIPGLPGVGEVTAKKLLKEFGSMENLLANTDKLKGKMKDNIEANKEKGLLSKTLATILLDCPVQFNETDYKLSILNNENHINSEEENKEEKE